MTMELRRIVSVGVFTCIEQESNDLGVAELRGKGERPVAILLARACKQAARIFDSPQARCDRQIERYAMSKQGIDRFEFPVGERGWKRAIRIGSIITEQIDQWKLHLAFTHYTAGANEPEGLINGGGVDFCAGLQDDLGDMHNVGGKAAVANGIFSDKFQECRIFEVVALKRDVFTW